MVKKVKVPYKNFEKLCKEHDVTSYEVSKITGISSATISSWKNGRYIPKLEKLCILADYFQVPVDSFIEVKKNA